TYVLFFFFQAEDGIRDFHVTGVQTCALPIYDKVIARMEGDFPVIDPSHLHYTDVAPNQISSISASLIPFLEHDDANRALMGSNRSEERRVGKECRYRWSQDQEKEIRRNMYGV